MINYFCIYSDYTPLTLEEWMEYDQRQHENNVLENIGEIK